MVQYVKACTLIDTEHSSISRDILLCSVSMTLTLRFSGLDVLDHTVIFLQIMIKINPLKVQSVLWYFFEHEKNKSYNCPICNVKFAVNICLKGHISSKHKKNKFYKCPICVVIFAVNISLKGHISSEHEKINLTNAQYVKRYLQ